ncbi:MAG: hypothetical protein KC572_02045 [Gammaproteobacteria bacterium]|nr:hypothetical protein [Gammaproteobacteria bacterium]
MLLRQTLIVLVIALLLCPGTGRAEEYRPSSYDECITDSMRGVGSDVAARAIIASCRNQFPATVPIETPPADSVASQPAPAQPVEAAQRPEQTAPGTSRSLTSGELQNLKSSAFIFAGSYRVTIQNKNEHLTVTEVTVAVWNASKSDLRRSYTLPITVPPHGTGLVTFKDVDPNPHSDSTWSDGSDDQWSIVAGIGRDPT